MSVGESGWRLVYTRQAKRDAKKIRSSNLQSRVETLFELLRRDPWETPPPYEKLVGDLQGAVSRRINIQHRLVYEVIEAEKVVKVIRMWTHYE